MRSRGRRIPIMLSFIQQAHVGTQLHRREWLRIGGLAGMNWALPGLIPRRTLAADSVANAAPGFGKAKSVIVVFASGGQSQIDMWDPKPDAPEQIRGAFDQSARPSPVCGLVSICHRLRRSPTDSALSAAWRMKI